MPVPVVLDVVIVVVDVVVVCVSVQQEGLDDGPDFLSEEDRGVSYPPAPL